MQQSLLSLSMQTKRKQKTIFLITHSLTNLQTLPFRILRHRDPLLGHRSTFYIDLRGRNIFIINLFPHSHQTVPKTPATWNFVLFFLSGKKVFFLIENKWIFNMGLSESWLTRRPATFLFIFLTFMQYHDRT